MIFIISEPGAGVAKLSYNYVIIRSDFPVQLKLYRVESHPGYLKSLPPVDHELPRTDLGPIGRVMLALGQLPPEAAAPDITVIDHNAPRPVAPESGITAEYGQYLTHITFAQCAT